MEYKYYERKINDIIMKCPIEAGVEILVYNVLDSIVMPEDFSLVDINRIWKNKDARLTTDSGISDIAVLSNDFEFKTEGGTVYGFIEIKATSVTLSETEQMKGQKSATNHYLYTNGLVWQYFMNGICQWTKVLEEKGKKSITVAQPISISKNEFIDLMTKLNTIKWKETLEK